MLFRKKLPRSCSYCRFSAKVDDEQMLCSKKGLVGQFDACRKFRYDPCKRIPPMTKAPDFSQYTEEDFKL